MDGFRIDLKAQQAETGSYFWEVGDAFFVRTGGLGVRGGNVTVTLNAHRVLADDYTLRFRFRGEVEVPCDRCLESVRLPVEGESELKARLGRIPDGDDEWIADDDGVVDVAWYIYEMIVLQIPMRHIHNEGECSGVMVGLLEQYTICDADSVKSPDARWDALKKVLDNN